MFRILMKALMIFALALGLVVPASALIPVNAMSGCAEMVAGAPDVPQAPCCDPTCTISRGTCAACVPIVAAYSLSSGSLPASQLDFSAAVHIDLTGITSPPEPPPPRTNLL